MKIPLVSVALLAAIPAAFAQTAQEFYAQGMRAFSGGDRDEAKALMVQALEIDPRHQGATAVLRRIEIDERQGATLERQLAAVVIEKVEFRDASLTSVLEYLPRAAAEAGGPPLNIVRVLPQGFAEERSVNLTLSNVPLTDILRYLAQVAGIDISYERHAVVVSVPES